MTIENVAPKKERRSRKNKAVVDEKAPLLPKRKDENEGFDEFNGASFSGGVFNLSTTIVGAGIMALPATMKVLGLILGVALIIFMAFLTQASIELLLRFSRAGKTVSYGGLMGDAFGKYGKIMLQVCILINNIGVLIVYMIIIGKERRFKLILCYMFVEILCFVSDRVVLFDFEGDVLSGTSSSGVHHSGILEGWFGEHWWNGRFFVLLLTTLLVFAPLSCFKRIG